MHFNSLNFFKIFLFVMLCVSIHSSEFVDAQDQTMDLMKSAINQAKEYQGLITLPEETNRQGENAAKEAFDRFQSKGVQERIDAEKKRIQGTFFSPFSPKSHSTETQENMCTDWLHKTEKVFLFISSSMPLNTLRAYVGDIDTLGDPNFVIVMRGFVGGMKHIRPTLDFMEKLMVRDDDCHLSEVKQCNMFNANIQIDPLIFSMLGIQQVPAIAYVKNLKKIDAQQSMGREGNLAEEIDAVVVYGDAALEFALERIFDETGSLQIKKAIQTLRGDFYEE